MTRDRGGTTRPEDRGGLLFAQVLDGTGNATYVSWSEVRTWKPGRETMWVHLERRGRESRRWLEEESGLEDVVVEELLSEATRPNLIALAEGLLINLRGVNLNPGARPEDMVWVQIWAEQGRIITSRHSKIAAVHDVREALADTSLRGPRNVGDVVVQLADRLLDRLGPAIAQIEDEMAELDLRSGDSVGDRPRRELRDLRRRTMMLRRWVGPQRDVIARLAADQSPLFDDGQRLRLQDEANRVTRYFEDLGDLRERASTMYDEMSQRLSEDMNRTMYILTGIAAVFLPLGLLTGLLGVNLTGIPFAEQPGSFAVFVAILVVILVVLTALFWRSRRRFL